MSRTNVKRFSDYIIYVDESGDHGLESIDPYYPVFVHEHDIRKPINEFTILFDRSVREAFMDGLSSLIESISFTMIASVIDKKKLMRQYSKPDNPYEISLSFGLERVYRHLTDIGQADGRTIVVVERRGKKEDEELELTFRRICDGNNFLNKELPYEIVMIDKKSNSTGLQIADVTARPIGIKTLRPHQPNRAYDIILSKFRTSPKGKIKGWGLKIFP